MVTCCFEADLVKNRFTSPGLCSPSQDNLWDFLFKRTGFVHFRICFVSVMGFVSAAVSACWAGGGGRLERRRGGGRVDPLVLHGAHWCKGGCMVHTGAYCTVET